jgi:DMSO/TMAO reductase YedYZ molybdopterin-dependent catalytic subunit
MSTKKERGFHELYDDDPERADAEIFGRRTGPSRRGFLGGAGLAAMTAAVGGSIAFADRMPFGLVPAALAQAAGSGPQPFSFEGKSKDLIVLQDRPLNVETPIHLLDPEITPAENMFIRNNGQIPDQAPDPKAWKVTIDGEVNTPLTLTVGELEQRFQPVTYRLQMECGGNGRSFFSPETRGNQWGHGAVHQGEWTGVRLGDVLKAAGAKPGAVYTGHYGADPHLSGDLGKQSISRGIPIAKAMDEHTIIALRLNGQPIPNIHGAPARLIAPGWPGSTSSKWLTRVWVRDRVHDGQGMMGHSYRLTRYPVVPGAEVREEDTVIMESMPVRSIITSIAHGTELPAGTRSVDLRGHAWAGERSVRAVDVTADYGASWQRAELEQPRNRYAWQTWRTQVRLPQRGYYELWVRATDSDGKLQPHTAGNWNPQGYYANPFHRVAVLVPA